MHFSITLAKLMTILEADLIWNKEIYNYICLFQGFFLEVMTLPQQIFFCDGRNRQGSPYWLRYL